ncbi:hypothetical protein BD779DRAFT_1454453 [Infundibulicybe gibba]|nr:hypothetical protein BD779DRAFT_1454453 [Infundibulicybe gibba]
MSADDEEIDGSEDEDGLGTGLEGPSVVASGSKHLPTVPPLKRRKLDVPYREARRLKREAQTSELMQAFEDITKMLTSKKTKFIGGINGLQARRARAMHAHMQLVVKKNRNFTTASMVAAEGHGFAPHWGGRQVRSWTRAWVKTRKLPVSWRGRHAKTDSLLADPAIATQCRTYLRSHKWSMDPSTLAQFSKNELIPAKAKKYLEQIVNEEMPRGLKKFMEIELFPRIHLKVGRGISLSTARDWLMTSQANDAREKTWVFQDQHALRKKGAGRGIHLSEVICSTYGHMKDAGQSLEYGKNYDGYWTGELFVKQVRLECNSKYPSVTNHSTQLREKIIPTFERLHGPGFQALIMVDNSQGHSAYSESALLVSRMNVNPGGKQAHMRDGWFMHNGQKIMQPMVFSPNHPKFPNEAKGIKAFHCEINFIEFFWGAVKKYLRENCDYTFDTLKENIPKAMESVPIQTIRRWEHRTHPLYRTGLNATTAQIQVRKFSSANYRSHRRIPEAVANTMD